MRPDASASFPRLVGPPAFCLPRVLKEYYVLLYFAYSSCELRFSIAPIAQLVEQLPLKETVPGSSPGGRTK